MGAASHASVYAYKKGTKTQKINATAFAFISILLIGFMAYSQFQCTLDLEYAIKRASEHVQSKSELDINYLGEAIFDDERCLCTFEYVSPTQKFTVLVTEYGALHFSRP